MNYRHICLGLLGIWPPLTSPASGQSPGPAPSSAPVPQPVLKAELQNKLLSLILEKGRDGELPATVARALGLTDQGQTWPDRQIAVRADATGEVHAVATTHGPGGDLVFSVRGEVAILIFRAHRDGTLASAINFFPMSQQSGPIPQATAQRQFVEECQFWNQAAAKLDAQNY